MNCNISLGYLFIAAEKHTKSVELVAGKLPQIKKLFSAAYQSFPHNILDIDASYKFTIPLNLLSLRRVKLLNLIKKNICLIFKNIFI